MLSCQLCCTIWGLRLTSLEPYDIFQHWYFVSNIGLCALVSTLFHNLGIKVYKLGTDKFPHWYFVSNSCSRVNSVSQGLQAWDYMINSNICILFPILDYVLSYQLFHNLGIMVKSHIGILFPILDFMLSCQLCFTILGFRFTSLGLHDKFQHWYFVSNIGLCALVSTLFHNLGIKVYKLGTMVNSHVGILFPILDFMLLCQLSQSWD